MPPRLELLVAVFELVAFFLVTPEIIGERRLEALYQWMGRLNHWIRTVYYSPDFGPVPPASIMLIIVLLGLALAAWLGLDSTQSANLLPAILAPIIIIPALFVLAYLSLAALRRRAALGRILALLGACLFVVGRLIVIASAYGRISP